MQNSNLSKAYPMNGGLGLYSYAKNSTSQGEVINSVKELINEAIMKKLDVDILCSSNTLRITDMGCSVGPNTIKAVQNILEALEKKFQCQGRQDQCGRLPEFQVFLNDHASNDFNTVFTSLPPNRHYHVAGVPGSFHNRLFPSASLHIVHSSYALQWLSRVPEEVGDRSSPAWNKGRIFYQNSGAQIIKAYADQFAKDMESFLHSRAQEVVCGGLVILTIPGGRLNTSSHSDGVVSNFIFDLLESCIVDMSKKGIISEEEVDSFNLPYYFPSLREIEEAVGRNGSFSIEKLESLRPKTTQASSITKEAKASSSVDVRAGLEIVLKEHFGPEIIDEVFESYRKGLEKTQVFHLGVPFNLFAVLKRKSR